jgi:hypothetical protein
MNNTPTWFAGAWRLMRKHGAGAGLEVLINILLPFILYEFTQSALGDFKALLCATVPPILWSLVEFLRSRRVDILSLFILTGIGLSLLAFVGGGSVRLLQLRENLATALVGVLFLVSAAIGKPLVYQLARAKYLRGNPDDTEALADLDDSQTRRLMTVITVVCGTGLVISSLFACLLVFVLSIATYLLVGPIVGYGTIGGLCLWAYWYARRQETPASAADDGEPP